MRLNFLIIPLFVLIGCSGTQKNREELSFRESRKNATTLASNEVYQIIDTTKIYKLIASYYKYDEARTNAVATYNYKKYLKFYGGGKLAVFDDFNLSSLDTLKAKKTDQGYYDYKFQTLYTRNYITNKSGKQFYNPQVHEIRDDTLSLYSQSTKNVSYYLPVAIPGSVFIEKANW